jgi:hypothetical protein
MFKTYPQHRAFFVTAALVAGAACSDLAAPEDKQADRRNIPAKVVGSGATLVLVGPEVVTGRTPSYATERTRILLQGKREGKGCRYAGQYRQRADEAAEMMWSL